MRIIDGLKFKGQPFEMPGCVRADLPEFFKEIGYKVGAEIGVCKGAFTEKFCKVGLKMFAVDGWLAYDDYNEPERNRQRRQDFLHEHTKRVLSSYPDCVIIRKLSMEAVKDFADSSLDFVYIDAHHGFKYVTEDIYEWSKKVRSGGVISGHDFIETNTIKVKIVLLAYTRAYRINNWYVLGRSEAPKGEKRESSRSWFWIKP
jgi:hypothetical protein